MQHLNLSKVKGKKQFYELFHRGVFGNHGPMWFSLEEMKADPHYRKTSPKVAIRTKRPSADCVYDISPARINKVYQTFLSKGYSKSELQFSEMVPIIEQTIQGYASITEHGLIFEYSLLKLPMREALNKGFHQATGLTASLLLKTYMLPVCHDWLFEIFSTFPNSVVEFTCLRVPWGVLPGWNTVFWEVRDY